MQNPFPFSSEELYHIHLGIKPYLWLLVPVFFFVVVRLFFLLCSIPGTFLNCFILLKLKEGQIIKTQLICIHRVRSSFQHVFYKVSGNLKGLFMMDKIVSNTRHAFVSERFSGSFFSFTILYSICIYTYMQISLKKYKLPFQNEENQQNVMKQKEYSITELQIF